MPMRQFTALFHDRTDQKTYNARVECTPGVLFIRLDTEMGPQTLEWVLADIQDAKAHDDGSVILQSGRQFLEVQEAGFEAALSAVFPKNKLFRRTFFDKIGVAGCILSILIAVLPFLALYWWGAPYLADRAARKVPKETETEIGEQLYQQMTATYTVDSVKTRLVQDFFRELGYPVSYPIHITVVKEPVVNAFAIPGGHIVVFDSILHLMDAPEQLAALLGHEASHVELRHSTRSLFRQLANSLVISIFMSDYGDMSSIVVQKSHDLAGLSYSRELELEADQQGLDWMSRQGIPQRGMPDLFRKMQTATHTENSQAMPDFLSTHPAMEERIALAEKRIGANAGGAITPTLQQLWQQIQYGTTAQ
jgi:beta-barrel assembly-enhancing protease